MPRPDQHFDDVWMLNYSRQRPRTLNPLTDYHPVTLRMGLLAAYTVT